MICKRNKRFKVVAGIIKGIFVFITSNRYRRILSVVRDVFGENYMGNCRTLRVYWGNRTESGNTCNNATNKCIFFLWFFPFWFTVNTQYFHLK